MKQRMKKTAASPQTQKTIKNKQPMALRKIIAIILLGYVFLASLFALGYFGAKTFYRSHQRREAMAAYEKGDFEKAEHLLKAYVEKDPNSEPEIVALANIYQKFDNPGMEAQMWQIANSLNPLNDEYREKLLTSAAKSASYELLHGILGRKIRTDANLSDRELYLYVISSCRSGYLKDGEMAYKKAVEADPEAFHKDELGQMAEFIATYNSLSRGKRDDFLNRAINSDDPMIRFEALYMVMSQMRANSADDDSNKEVEALLKQIVDTNYLAGTPYLADFYYSLGRFDDVIAVAEPYLKTIDNLYLYLLYAESCIFTDKLENLKYLEKKLRGKNETISFLARYCSILIAYLENDIAKLAENVHKSGKIVSSPLSRFIRLRVAIEQDSFYEILSVAKEVFANPPFHDLHNRALLLCLDYLAEQMRKPENQNDPSRMAELAKILAGQLRENRLLTDIILVNQYKKGLAKESDLMDALEIFPDDPILLDLTAEFLIFNNKVEQAFSLIEHALSNGMNDRKLDFLYMLALDQMEHHDEAADIFRRLVELSEFDLNLLADYFKFCQEHERIADLSAMADKLEGASDEKLKPYAPFFHAAVLLLKDDETKKQEALMLLAATPNDNPEFAFYAAGKLAEADMLNEAEAKYRAIQKTYKAPALILVNLSEVYKAKGEVDKALDSAKEAYSIEKNSMLPTFIYAKRLSEAERYEEAVDALKFPRREVSYPDEVVDLWVTCMKQVIENSIREQRFLQAEEQCRHLLIIAPDNVDGIESMEKIREALSPENKDSSSGNGITAA